MKGFRKCWLCTVQSRYVALIKSGEKSIEVRARIPRNLKEGDGLYIMEKGMRELALVARIGSITTYDRVGLYVNLPRYIQRRTCLSLEEIDQYLNGRPQVNFLEITPVWIPQDNERKYLTPEYYGYRCMPQGIFPLPGKWKV